MADLIKGMKMYPIIKKAENILELLEIRLEKIANRFF